VIDNTSRATAHPTPMVHSSRAALSAASCLLAGPMAMAQIAAPAVEQVVVTGSIAERAAVEAPYAITVIDAATLRSSGPLVNLSEAMARVPGLVVANRNNYAQDLQISSRGFGARAGFGVRGLRLYSDGIPATMPDGQGQVSHFDLAGAQRVEVLRGPFSVLYGNSSGGVIALVGAPVREGRVDASADIGSFGLRQLRAGVATPLGGGFDLRASAATLEWEGFRPHSAARKQSGNVRLGYEGGADRVVVQLNALDQPADDPLGLTQQQFDVDPDQTTPQATQFDTRKTARQLQGGAQWRHRFDAAGPLRESTVMVYGGQRSVVQWLAIAAGTQSNARHGGGVIDFDRDYDGVDARLAWRWDGIDLVTGAALEHQRDARRGYLNYTGTVAAPIYGVIGDLRRDETNRARSTDAYAQLEAPLAGSLVASAGVRSGKVRLSADDHYLGNGDDSGQRDFRYTNPVLGLRWSAMPGLHLHASVARGFESPTLGELAYRADGSGGFNTTLLPQQSRQIELGAKWRSGNLSLDAALFRIDVDDEIGVATNAGGRSAFQNVGRTQRSGAELALAWRLAPAWRTQLAVTLLDATYRDGFLACAGIPCSAPTVPIPAGNRIAGTQRGNAFAELVWQPARATEVALEVRAASALTANDSNTQAAPRYALCNLRASQRYVWADGVTLELLARLDNATDRVYAGSVIVNDANGRHFEAGAPRSALLSARLSRTF
jgi:iron complex outermembrane receptor protein